MHAERETMIKYNMIKRFFQVITAILLLLVPTTTQAFDKNTGDLQNLVCFVRFADEDEVNTETERRAFDQSVTTYQQLFNDETSGANSVFNYFRVASYGQLSWRSTFYPVQQGENIVSMQVAHTRTYYQQKSSVAPDGYEDETEKANRELTLVTEICNKLNNALDDAVMIDQNNDGIVDNLTIVLSNGSEIGNKHLLWPHRSDLALPDDKAVRIKGKKMTSYLMVFDYANGYGSQFNPLKLNTGTLCHEMSHSLGTYDLYHVNDKLNPVGVWDLMSDNQMQAQQMTVYTKWRYCKWIDEIPEIKAHGTYTLHPVESDTKDNIAYKIHPVGRDEYFVLEYRRKAGFDSNLPAEGLLVYRINPAYTGGNVNYNGTTRLDEQYIFRPGGTTTADGTISQATLSAESGRTGIGGAATLQPFYSDGTKANFAIANVSTCGETISFDLLESNKQLILSQESFTLKGQANAAASLTIASDDDWTITGVPAWLTVTPVSGNAGTTTVSLTANSDNTTGATREATLTVTSNSDAALNKSFTIAQEQQTGNVILSDNFENTQNPLGWVIENEGESGKGWQYTEGTTNGKAKKMVNSGTHAMSMLETFSEEIHQDAKLTSPTFANGTLLTFYSHTNGGNATPKQPPLYLVEVSSDNGNSWTSLFNVLGDYPRDAEGKTVTPASGYQKIVLDLTPYQSETMKIRFHCYDTTNEGLQYWWQIDDVEITGAADASGITLSPITRQSAPIYDLQGRRLSKKPSKGTYVSNGKIYLR